MNDIAIERPCLPVGSKGREASGWWGMLTVILTEGALFGYLLFSYFYLASHHNGSWPPSGPLSFHISAPGTVLLLLGSGTMWWAERGIEAGRQGQLRLGLVVTLVIGAVFLGMQMKEWSKQAFTLTSDVFGSLYFTITGFHMTHVAAGLLMLLALLAWAFMDKFSEARHSPVSIAALYWHFVTAVWLLIFFSFYIAPRMG